jgi:hypothetical protein
VAVACGNIGSGMCDTIKPTVGILGTPVVDENTNHIFLVTYSQILQNGALTYYHRIHALFTGLGGTTALAEDTTYNSPQIISSGASNPPFIPATHIQRPGLLLLPGTQSATPYVYVAFSMMDGATNYPPGFIFRYYGDDLSQVPLVFTTEPNLTTGAGGGIWMDGAAPAAGVDASGGSTFLYFTTADGTFDKNVNGSHCVDCGDSFVKLTYGLGATSFFTPKDQACRFSNNSSNPDQDFGSGGVLLIPDGLLSSWPYLAVAADKNQSIWVMQRPSPGLYGGNSGCTGTNANLETVAGTGLYHNTPAFWQNGASTGYLYLSSVGGSLKQYPVQSSCNPGAGSPPLCSSTAASVDPSGSPIAFNSGTTPSISSNSTTDGIVWALSGMSLEGTTVGALYAFKAQDLTHIYDSNQCQGGADHMNSATSFSLPTIANGFVYVGTQSDNVTNVGKGTFYIFGKLPTQGTSC